MMSQVRLPEPNQRLTIEGLMNSIAAWLPFFPAMALPVMRGAAVSTVEYKTLSVDGVNLFYREAGPKDGPVLLLLHGFPSSSRMYAGLIPLLVDQYHLIAPDYPGFGHSEAPPPEAFTYTFDHLAQCIDGLLENLGVHRYALFVQDYGGPVGFRLAVAHPERTTALIVQNAVAHEEGLSTLWEPRRAFWRDRTTYEERVRQNLLSLEAIRQRHVGASPHPERIDPDTWTYEHAFLTRPGMDRIQLELFYDYRTNVAAYPRWQAYLREQRPPTLVVWGKYDPSFTVAGALAYGRDVPEAEIHLLNAGHFALDEALDVIAALSQRFLQAHR
jgi:pimeloyl-ACP methyl ester carboxylesterase